MKHAVLFWPCLKILEGVSIHMQSSRLESTELDHCVAMNRDLVFKILERQKNHQPTCGNFRVRRFVVKFLRIRDSRLDFRSSPTLTPRFILFF